MNFLNLLKIKKFYIIEEEKYKKYLFKEKKMLDELGKEIYK